MKKLLRETRFRGCECGGTFECKVNSNQKYFQGHYIRINYPMKNPETAKKCSNTKGSPPPRMPGFHHFEEAKANMRKPRSKEGRRNIKAANNRLEVKRQRVETRRNNGNPWVSEEAKARMRTPHPGICGDNTPLKRLDVKVKQKASLRKYYEEYPGSHAGEHNGMFGTHCYGNDNPNWQGGVSNKPYPFEFNTKFREFVRERYDYICMLCKLTQEHFTRYIVHHIDYDKDNLDPDNFVLLCNSCHSRTGGKRNRVYWIRVFQRIVEINK